MAPIPALRCGRIKYTNDLPLYAAFDLGVLEFPGVLIDAVPSELNRGLLAGELDVSPVSSMFYAQHADELALLGGICIGSRREAKSIQCISAVHPRELAGTRIAVTTESATGRALFDVICRSGFGFTPSLESSDDPVAEHERDGTPCLVIGDVAIDAAFAHPEQAHDVGTLWYGLTGADMVYALWAMRKDRVAEQPERMRAALQAIVPALRASAAFGRDHGDEVVRLAQSQRPRPDGFYESYYRALNYDYDEQAQDGFLRFCTMAQACGVLDAGVTIGRAPESPEFVDRV
ncbi:MAG TPA: menaquinone biosynthesis protein [Candidatus Binatus sp.]|nr:menaquinone biosynthesis protein [Candidatus Binatus sp.]